MDFVLLNGWKSGLSREERDGALARRSQWNYPAGVEVVAEYWPASENPAVVAIVRTEDFAGLMELQLTWGDTFDITVLPAISAEDGLKIGPDVMERRQV